MSESWQASVQSIKQITQSSHAAVTLEPKPRSTRQADITIHSAQLTSQLPLRWPLSASPRPQITEKIHGEEWRGGGYSLFVETKLWSLCNMAKLTYLHLDSIWQHEIITRLCLGCVNYFYVGLKRSLMHHSKDPVFTACEQDTEPVTHTILINI